MNWMTDCKIHFFFQNICPYLTIVRKKREDEGEGGLLHDMAHHDTVETYLPIDRDLKNKAKTNCKSDPVTIKSHPIQTVNNSCK